MRKLLGCDVFQDALHYGRFYAQNAEMLLLKGRSLCWFVFMLLLFCVAMRLLHVKTCGSQDVAATAIRMRMLQQAIAC